MIFVDFFHFFYIIDLHLFDNIDFMATITIENVPEATLRRIGKRIDFQDVRLTKKRKTSADPTIRLHELSQDPENTVYGPFTPKEFLEELNKM